MKSLSPPNIKAELDSTLEESAPSFTTIKYWVAEFKRSRTSCQDEKDSSRPNEVTTTELAKKIHKMVLDDRQLKVRELADMVGPHLLTMEEKQRRENVSIECSAMFHRNKADFLHRLIIIDETLVHHFTPDMKIQSK